MKPVDQTKFGKPEGNCYAACLASIFEVPIEECPDYSDIAWGDDNDFATAEGAAEWQRRTNEFLARFGVYECCLSVPGLLQGDWRPQGWTILGGEGPRGLEHAVVGKGLDMVHDPHPSREGLVRVKDVTFFVIIDPVEHLRRP